MTRLAIAATALLALAAPANAHSAGGFEPSDATLACIRRYEGGYTSVSRSGRHRGAYQADRAFTRAYTAAIPDEHFALWGTPRTDLADRLHPMIQDEAARNGIRARGLRPWPTPSRRCR